MTLLVTGAGGFIGSAAVNLSALHDSAFAVYGRGANVRKLPCVEDQSDALLAMRKRDALGCSCAVNPARICSEFVCCRLVALDKEIGYTGDWYLDSEARGRPVGARRGCATPDRRARPCVF